MNIVSWECNWKYCKFTSEIFNNIGVLEDDLEPQGQYGLGLGLGVLGLGLGICSSCCFSS